jgi:hypothetical protein
MKQISDRYKVREDPCFNGLWCIINRSQLFIVDTTPYFHRKYNPDWRNARVIAGIEPAHFTDFDDAIEFVRLIELSEMLNEI